MSHQSQSHPSLSDLPASVKADLLFVHFGFSGNVHQSISQWWLEKHPDLELHHFPFPRKHHLLGCSLTRDKIALNSASFSNPDLLLYATLHESHHCSEHEDAHFIATYFETAAHGDFERFHPLYLASEHNANDYAVRSMRELGRGSFIDKHEVDLRSNELSGEHVFRMVVKDISLYGSTSFTDLMLSQILAR
jgi:hypothetical protein